MTRLTALTVGLLILNGTGCGTLLIAFDREIMTSSHDTTENVGEQVERVREVRYSAADQAIVCDVESRYPAVRTHHWHAGYDSGGRFAFGFIGIAEMAFGSIVAGSALGEEELTAGHWIGAGLAGLLAVDGLIALIMAFALPDFVEEETTETEGSWAMSLGCPDGAELALGELRLSVNERGQFALPKEASVYGHDMELRFEHEGETIGLNLDMETRCSLASSLGLRPPGCESAQVTPPPSFELRFDLAVTP